MPISIQFYGAARQVTGSRHLVELGDRRILLDCGMVQGPRKISNKLNNHLQFDPEQLDAIVLSHGHIDHSGSLPRAVRLGYRGPIHCTEATADLLEILLPDSAHIQASDARYLHKRGRHFEPAYDMEDVERTLKQLVTHDLDEEFEVLRGARATFLEAGHIIGAAQVVLDLEHEGDALRLGFTGDLGRRGLPILRDPAPMPPCDVLVTESTYGDRVHPSREAVVAELEEALTDELAKGGRVLIPAFSVGRTQEVLWFLGELIRAGKLPPQDVFIDSPLSNKATRIVDRHRDLYDEEARALLEQGIHPFHFPGVRAVESVEESKALNKVRSGVIISASGMCEGGRILHHLEVSLGRPEDLILIVGFQAEGTLGRRLVDGHESVRVFGEEHEVRCRVRYIQGLSAHADREELLAQALPSRERARQVFVVHGEEDASARFAARLRREGFRGVEVPVYRERFKLGIQEGVAAEA